MTRAEIEKLAAKLAIRLARLDVECSARCIVDFALEIAKAVREEDAALCSKYYDEPGNWLADEIGAKLTELD